MNFLLDSGAHSLYTKYVIKEKHKNNYNFYSTDIFYDFVDRYIKFIIKYKKYINNFVGVDVIFNPEKTLEIQEYIEKKYNIRPMPVIHYGEDLKYIDLYINKGYEYIGVGGLGQEVSKRQYFNWADLLFKKICDKKGIPKIKTHGFAMTSVDLMIRYPWHSVDSSSWLKLSAYGKIFMPKYKKGKYQWLETPAAICISNKSYEIIAI